MDDAGLSYHDPANLGTTMDMDVCDEEVAIENGAVQCSECFPEQDGVMYSFPYLDGVTVS